MSDIRRKPLAEWTAADYWVEDNARRGARMGSSRTVFTPPPGGPQGMIRGWQADEEQRERETVEAAQQDEIARQKRLEEYLLAFRIALQEIKDWLVSILPSHHKETRKQRGTKGYISAILQDVMEAVRASFNRRGKPYANNNCPFTGAEIARLLYELGLLDESDKPETVEKYVRAALGKMGYTLSPEGGRPEGEDSSRSKKAEILLADVKASLGGELGRLKLKRP